MSRKFQVYGIGNGIVDLQMRVNDDTIEQFALTKGEMRLVDLNSQNRLLMHARGIAHRASGGSAANTMIGLVQLGAKAAFSCLLGDDEYGHFYCDEMRALGVHIEAPFSKAEPTGTCVVLITPDAERTMNTHLAASAGFGSEHVNEALIRDSEWLYVEGYLFSSESGQEAVRKALRIAKEAGTKVAVTFSDGFIVEVFGDSLRAAVKQADLIFANINEARKFTGETDDEKVFAKLRTAAPNVVMTRSEKGVWLNVNDQETRLPAFAVKAVDDTGAGDMFAGGFLYGLTSKQSPETSAKIACFLASRVVSQLGPRLMGNVKSLLAENKII